MTGTVPASDDLGAVFSSLQHSLRTYLRRQVGDDAVAEDLLQEIFVKALIAARTKKTPRNLPGWLYAVARNTVIDYYRSKRPSKALDENVPDIHADDELLHQQLSTCLRPFVEQLPVIYRDTLIATDFEGRSMQSVADEQGLSLSAIKSRASRARVMLKQKLLDCCHVETAGGMVTDYYQKVSGACSRDCD